MNLDLGEIAAVNEAWVKLWKLKEGWRNGELDGEEAMYEIETLMDEVGQ